MMWMLSVEHVVVYVCMCLRGVWRRRVLRAGGRQGAVRPEGGRALRRRAVPARQRLPGPREYTLAVPYFLAAHLSIRTFTSLFVPLFNFILV